MGAASLAFLVSPNKCCVKNLASVDIGTILTNRALVCGLLNAVLKIVSLWLSPSSHVTAKWGWKTESQVVIFQ